MRPRDFPRSAPWYVKCSISCNRTPVVSRQPQDALGAEIRRGQRLDRELARRLGRPEPDRAAPGAYVDSIDDRPVLPAARERELVAAAKAGDPAARAQLVEAFMPLIGAAARGYARAHVQRAELLQEGVVGLLRALDGFDPQRGVPFWGYAAWWVRQAMQQLVAELTRRVVLAARYGFEGDEQSLRQVGARLGLSAERVRQIEQRAIGKLATALDAP